MWYFKKLLHSNRFFIPNDRLNRPSSFVVPTCGIDELIGAFYESFLKVEISGENYTDNIGTGNIRYEAGALGRFTCSDKNMQLIGEAQTTCLSNGSWTDPGHQKCGINIKTIF